MRITATVAVLALLALALAGLVVYVVEARRLDSQTRSEVDRTLDEFADASRASGATSLDALFRSYIEQEVPTGDELFVGVDADGHQTHLGSDPAFSAPGFEAGLERVLRSGGSTHVDDSPAGPLLLTAQPVVVGGQRGAFVVVSKLHEDHEYLHDTVVTYTTVSALSLLVVVGVAFWQAGRLLAPLRTLRLTADEIGETDLSRRVPVRGNDDISALTHTVNGMLTRLEAAFAAQREFLDDAGHELKTPLTILRGHLELLDAGDPTEVADTRALLLDEVDRMARLVGDLILLAKSERPGFLAVGPTDVARLTETVLAKASGLGPRRWVLDGTADVVVPLDEQRLTQALLQLAHNAVVHTDEGDEVAIGSSVVGHRIILWVRDSGPGVAPADRERIFERFGRGPETGGEDDGFGLGLSIVAAIARAHGGSVRLDPAYDEGARFVVDLPAPRAAGS